MDYEQAKELFEHIISVELWFYKNYQYEKQPQDRVRFKDPHNTWVDERVKIGDGTLIFPGCCILGETKIGKRCVIWPNTTIINCVLGDDVMLGLGKDEQMISYDITPKKCVCRLTANDIPPGLDADNVALNCEDDPNCPRKK